MARTREEITREIAGYLLGLIGVLVLLARADLPPPRPLALLSRQRRGPQPPLPRRGGGGGHPGRPPRRPRAGRAGGDDRGGLALAARESSWRSPGIQGGSWAVAVVGGAGLLTALAGRASYRGGELELGGEVGPAGRCRAERVGRADRHAGAVRRRAGGRGGVRRPRLAGAGVHGHGGARHPQALRALRPLGTPQGGQPQGRHAPRAAAASPGAPPVRAAPGSGGPREGGRRRGSGSGACTRWP